MLPKLKKVLANFFMGFQEVAIRTLGVSLVAIAAVAASLALARQRTENRVQSLGSGPDNAVPPIDTQPDLEQIRAAGW